MQTKKVVIILKSGERFEIFANPDNSGSFLSVDNRIDRILSDTKSGKTSSKTFPMPEKAKK